MPRYSTSIYIYILVPSTPNASGTPYCWMVRDNEGKDDCLLLLSLLFLLFFPTKWMGMSGSLLLLLWLLLLDLASAKKIYFPYLAFDEVNKVVRRKKASFSTGNCAVGLGIMEREHSIQL